jgi:hypothetical protein
VKDKWNVLIAIIVIAGMLITSIGVAFAEPYHILSGRDKVGTYGQDGKSARLGYINTNVFEGSTYDTNKTWLSAIDPTGTNVILLPNASGTLATTDATLTGTFTGTVNGTILDSTDANIFVSNGTSMESVAVSGDITITNTGAASIGANKVGTAETFVNSIDVIIAASGTSGTATVTSGSTILGHYGVGNVYDIAINGITNVSISGTTLTALINGTAGSQAVVHKVVVLEP